MLIAYDIDLPSEALTRHLIMETNSNILLRDQTEGKADQQQLEHQEEEEELQEHQQP